MRSAKSLTSQSSSPLIGAAWVMGRPSPFYVTRRGCRHLVHDVGLRYRQAWPERPADSLGIGKVPLWPAPGRGWAAARFRSTRPAAATPRPSSPAEPAGSALAGHCPAYPASRRPSASVRPSAGWPAWPVPGRSPGSAPGRASSAPMRSAGRSRSLIGSTGPDPPVRSAEPSRPVGSAGPSMGRAGAAAGSVGRVGLAGSVGRVGLPGSVLSGTPAVPTGPAGLGEPAVPTGPTEPTGPTGRGCGACRPSRASRASRACRPGRPGRRGRRGRPRPAGPAGPGRDRSGTEPVRRVGLTGVGRSSPPHGGPRLQADDFLAGVSVLAQHVRRS